MVNIWNENVSKILYNLLMFIELNEVKYSNKNCIIIEKLEINK